MKPVTFKELFEFVLANKTNKTFRGMSDEDILWSLQDGIKAGSLFFATNQEGKLVGMILAQPNPETRVLFVLENLAMSIATLRLFAKMAKERFPDYKLEWMKHGVHKQHDTDKFYRKMHV